MAKPFRFGPPVPKDEPVTSIIIPFYGDAFFLNCVYHLQRILGTGFELVLVVDDPRIWPEIYGRLASRSTVDHRSDGPAPERRKLRLRPGQQPGLHGGFG